MASPHPLARCIVYQIKVDTDGDGVELHEVVTMLSQVHGRRPCYPLMPRPSLDLLHIRSSFALALHLHLQRGEAFLEVMSKQSLVGTSLRLLCAAIPWGFYSILVTCWSCCNPLLSERVVAHETSLPTSVRAYIVQCRPLQMISKRRCLTRLVISWAWAVPM